MTAKLLILPIAVCIGVMMLRACAHRWASGQNGSIVKAAGESGSKGRLNNDDKAALDAFLIRIGMSRIG
jgi:hypothetical protein